jgi:hypothetical protein
MPPPSPRDEAVKLVLKKLGERRETHATLCSLYAERERSFYAQVDRNHPSRQWTDQMEPITPPYVMQVVDTVVANLSDDRTRFKVLPRPRMADRAELDLMAAGARAHELLLSYQLDRDRYNRKKASWIMQNAIKGVSPLKAFWHYETGTRPKLVSRPVFDDYGNETGTETGEEDYPYVYCDDPATSVVPAEDFMWAEGSTEIQKAPWVIERCAVTFDDLKRLEKAGVYKGVDSLQNPKERDGHQDEFANLDADLRKDKRFKNRVEVLEFWTKEGGELRCITVGDRKVLLADRRGMFWHGQYPYSVLVTRPNLFQVQGRSTVESISQLQSYLHTLMNQRIANLMLLNNAVFAVRDDILDRDALEFFPGAIWPISGDVDTAVKQFTPDPTVTQMSLAAEALAKGDLQNVTGGMPFMSGTNSQTVDQETATGVSIITSLAQRMIAHQQQWVRWAEEDLAHQFIALNQQFVREDRLVPIIGADGAQLFEQIEPLMLQGTYVVDVGVTTDSLMRQERRAEAQAMLQMAAQIAPIGAALGAPLNIKAFIDEYLRAYDIHDTERFYSAQPQPQLGGAPGMPGQPNGNGGGPTNGTTAPEAYAASSPSNANSLSGEQFLARLGSMQGGANNV